MEKQSKTVMVFGTFDILHDGHQYFLREAKKLGKKLVVAVAQDSFVETFKNHPPRHSFKERVRNLERELLADAIVSGDIVSGSWNVIDFQKPDIIALGYDQRELEQSLLAHLKKKNLSIPVIKIPPFKEGSLHSSSLKTNE